MLRLAVALLGVVVVTAPMPLADPLAIALRLLGLAMVVLAMARAPVPHEDFFREHEDAVRDVFADARDRLMNDDVATIDDRVCRHAEVILGSKYYA